MSRNPPTANYRFNNRLRANRAFSTPAVGSGGFTLIELVSVMVVFGILSAFLVPKINTSLTQFHQRFMYDETVTALRYARNRAVAKQCTFGVLLGNRVTDSFELEFNHGATSGFAVVTAPVLNDSGSTGVCVTVNLNDLISLVPRPYAQEPEIADLIERGNPFFNGNSRNISMTNTVIGFDSLGQPIVGNQRVTENQTICVGGRSIIVYALSGLIETPTTSCAI